jgi:hypothetical protein
MNRREPESLASIPTDKLPAYIQERDRANNYSEADRASDELARRVGEMKRLAESVGAWYCYPCGAVHTDYCAVNPEEAARWKARAAQRKEAARVARVLDGEAAYWEAYREDSADY